MFADNYYQQTLVDFIGNPISGAYNRKITNLIGAHLFDHSDIHLWYHGTIQNETPVWDGSESLTQDERDIWWETDEGRGLTAGFYYSRIFGGNRLSNYSANTESNMVVNRFNSFYEGSGERVELDLTGANWPNIIKNELSQSGIPLGHDSATIPIGETIDVIYTGQDYDSSSSVNLYLDVDKNPYNNNNIITSPIGTENHNATGDGYHTRTVPVDTTSFPATTGYIYAQITDGSHTRHMYASTKLNFIYGSLPDSVTLPASADTSVVESSPDLPFGNSITFWAQTDASDYYGLIRFNLGSIPEGSTVQNAILKLYRSYAVGSQLNVREIGSSWSESSVIWNTQPTPGSNDSFWYNVPGTGFQNIGDFALTNLVQGWVNGTESNYGVYLMAGNHGTSFSFSSSENSNSSERPQLIVDFTPPPIPSTPSTPSVTDGTYTDKVQISWNTVSGATT